MGQRSRGPRGGRTGRRGLALVRQLRGSQEGARRRGRGPDPPQSRGGKTETQPSARRPALPCPARRRAARPSVARWPPPPPPAPPRPQPPLRADESPPPTAGPPSPARLPALLGHGPLHPSRLLTALRRIPLGGCVAILSELQSQDRPRPQSDWEATGDKCGAHKALPLPGRSARVTPPTHFRLPALWYWDCWEGAQTKARKQKF
nr:actin nucleation-promoting factor WASL-like isoform X2 [Kogia breviceps]